MSVLSRRTEQDPFMSMRRDLNTWLSSMFLSPFRGRSFFPTQGLFAPLDVREKNGNYLVTMDIPGVDEDDLRITFRDHLLVVSGERREERDERAGGQVRYREVRYGSFQRSIPLPDNVDRDRVSAKYRDGVLIITLPKTNGSKEERQVDIQRESKTPM